MNRFTSRGTLLLGGGLLLGAICVSSALPAARREGPPPGAGWQALLNGKDLSGWTTQDGTAARWTTTAAVRSLPEKDLEWVPGAGGLMVNGRGGKTANLFTQARFADIELHVEFLVPKGSNSGVYLHGLYEVQVKDSYGTDQPTLHDCGGIYERWIDGKGVGGRAPSLNASLPAGEWQSFDIQFRAPRFDAAGKKTAAALFVSVLHNGKLIHNNVAAEGPTRASMDLPEGPRNPLMLQGDHGPVAYRNIYIRALGK